MASTGQRIRELRKERQWTQSELGNKIGVSSQAISNWERDYSTPIHSDLTKLAHIFSTTTDYLLGRTDNIFSDQLDMADRIEIMNMNDNIEDFFSIPRKEHVSFDLLKLLQSSYTITVLDYQLSHAERTLISKLVELQIITMRKTSQDLIHQAEDLTNSRFIWNGQKLEMI